ncbi:MAG TPA: IclR family transcriptional regulator [Alphaproteobacteria bacterium]|jgi:DNA-binding IclR family transcriptional regulator
MRNEGVKSVERALSILVAFREGERELPLREIAARTKLNKATVLRLICSLERHGFMLRLGDGKYALGPAPFHIGRVYQRSFHLADHVIPVLRDIVQHSAESSAFYIRNGERRICLHKVESGEAMLRVAFREGDSLPLDGSTGAVLRAFYGEEGADMEQTRADHYNVSMGQRHPEITSIACPVFRTGQEVAGSLSMSGPTSHYAGDRLATHLVELLDGAVRLTRTLGGDVAPLDAAKRKILSGNAGMPAPATAQKIAATAA